MHTAARTGLCEWTRGDPVGDCPTFCVPTGWARSGSARARRDPPVQAHARLGLVDVYGEAGDPFRTAAEACGEGAAEWLGAWVAWDRRPGSACLARVADDALPSERWAVIER